MKRAEQIQEALHMVRSPTATNETFRQLHAALRGATPDEISLGTLKFSYALLRASHSVLQFQLDAAIAQELREEGGLQ